MTVVREDTVRQLHLRRGLTEIRVEPGAYITQGAKDYIKEKRLKLVVEGEGSSPPENRDIRPAPGAGRWVTLEGAPLGDKPEHMTHLYGNVLVAKDHPRIALRGKLDSLQAEIVAVQVRAAADGGGNAAQAIQEILTYCRAILSAEVTGRPLEEQNLLGLDEAGLRHASQHPMEHFGIGHLMPDYRLGPLCADLNRLRTQAREVELSAVAAFCPTGASAERPDLLRALNRLSSAFYILMLRRAAEGEERTHGTQSASGADQAPGPAARAGTDAGAVCTAE